MGGVGEGHPIVACTGGTAGKGEVGAWGGSGWAEARGGTPTRKARGGAAGVVCGWSGVAAGSRPAAGAEEAATGVTSSVGGRRYRKQGADEEVPAEEDGLHVKIRPGKVGSM